MPTHRQAESADHALLRAVLIKYHPRLVEIELRVGLLTEVALKDRGYPVAAVIRVNSQRDRVDGKPDCTIVLDRDSWPDRSQAERIAILDHECEHIEIVMEKTADGGMRVKRDDCGRPCCKLRKHDIVVGGFSSIIERHKEVALEARHIAEAGRFVQGLFNY